MRLISKPYVADVDPEFTGTVPEVILDLLGEIIRPVIRHFETREEFDQHSNRCFEAMDG